MSRPSIGLFLPLVPEHVGHKALEIGGIPPSSAPAKGPLVSSPPAMITASTHTTATGPLLLDCLGTMADVTH